MFAASFETAGFEFEIALCKGAGEPAEKESDGTSEYESHDGAGAVRDWFDRVNSSDVSAETF